MPHPATSPTALASPAGRPATRATTAPSAYATTTTAIDATSADHGTPAERSASATEMKIRAGSAIQ